MKRTDPAAHHHRPEGLDNEEVAHEHSDINIRAVLTFAAVLAAVGIVVHVLMYGVLWYLEGQARVNDPELSPLAAPAAQMPPSTIESPAFGTAPQPQLLTNEYGYLSRQRQAEEQQLTSYGWIDEASGVARVPIESAKKLLLERGLPTRADGIVDESRGTERPSRGEASSGRIVDGPPRGAGLPEVAAPGAGGNEPRTGGH